MMRREERGGKAQRQNPIETVKEQFYFSNKCISYRNSYKISRPSVLLCQSDYGIKNLEEKWVKNFGL